MGIIASLIDYIAILLKFMLHFYPIVDLENHSTLSKVISNCCMMRHVILVRCTKMYTFFVCKLISNILILGHYGGYTFKTILLRRGAMITFKNAHLHCNTTDIFGFLQTFISFDVD